MSQSNTHIVIMAGGIGSRLWPLSTPERPKQFIDVLGVGRTLIQLTVDRFLQICPISNFWVVTSENFVSLVKEQLPGIDEDHILAEPEPRNTAPCIAYACWKIARRHPKANIVVTPSDAIVLNTEKFRTVISDALEFTATSAAIVTVGIAPDRPETGYGYIKAVSTERDKVVKVLEFKEKPDVQTAKSYVEAGNYFWNAGIFVWNVSTITSQLRKFVPQITGIMDELSSSFYTADEKTSLAELFPKCDKISIDYAVMEKSEDIFVIASDLGWSDLGSWTPLRNYLTADSEGNSVVGPDVRLFDCDHCVVHVEDEKMVVLQGLKGYVVVENEGRLLVCQLSQEQRIKEFSQK